MINTPSPTPDDGTAADTAAVYTIGGHAMKPFPEACRPYAAAGTSASTSSLRTTFEQCMQLVAKVLASFRSEVERLYPPLDAGAVVGISGLWHLARELLNVTDHSTSKVHLSPAALERQAIHWCTEPNSWNVALDSTPTSLRVDPCFKACYVLELLRSYGVPRDKDVQIMDRVNWGHGFILQTAEHGLVERAEQSNKWFWQNKNKHDPPNMANAFGGSSNDGSSSSSSNVGGGGRLQVGEGGNRRILFLAVMMVVMLFGSLLIRDRGTNRAFNPSPSNMR